MIKKLLLTLSFIALIAIAFSGTTYKAQAADTITVAEELTKLNDLYKEGVITEEEFSKAKSILLNPDAEIGKKEKKKKEKLTAAERKQLKDAEQEELKALKEQLRAEKKACSEDPESKACKEGKPSEKIKNVLKKIEKKLGG